MNISRPVTGKFLHGKQRSGGKKHSIYSENSYMMGICPPGQVPGYDSI